jgi:DNA-binding PadR family transcriptional regulator
MYPILMRLADRGWLDTSWEEAPPMGRPPRHLYRLTESGLVQARELGRDKRATLTPHPGLAV